MGTLAQSTTIVTQMLENENGMGQVQTVGLGVTPAALDVFSNFVQHAVANAAPPTIDSNLPVEPHKLQPRRSKRFATLREVEDLLPLTLPAPPQPLVRSQGPRVVLRGASVRVSSIPRS